MIKVKTVKKKSDNSEILKLFNQLTGVEDPDPVVVESKYENFMYHSENIIKAWTVFCKSPFAQLIKNDLPERFKEIVNFVVESKKFLSEMSIPVSDNKFKTNSFSDSILDDFKEILIKYDPQLLVKNYKTIKNSILRVHITNTLANISNLLADDNKRNNKILDCLCDKNNLSNTFITQTALDTKLLSFSILDFQYLYNIYGDRIGEFDNLILIVLRVTYCSALEIKKLIFSPDINIAEFVQAFGKRLDETSKEIPGCDRAFMCLKNHYGCWKRILVHIMMNIWPQIIQELFLKTSSWMCLKISKKERSQCSSRKSRNT
jgi:hypothetical protein